MSVKDLVQTIRNPLLRHVGAACTEFLDETRAGTANVDQARIGAVHAGRVISAVSVDLKERLAASRIQDADAK